MKYISFTSLGQLHQSFILYWTQSLGWWSMSSESWDFSLQSYEIKHFVYVYFEGSCPKSTHYII